LPSGINADTLQVVSTWESQKLWLDTLQDLSEILSQPIWTILIGWWEQADQVEVEDLPSSSLTVPSNSEGVVAVWCGLWWSKGGLEVGVAEGADVLGEENVFLDPDVIGEVRSEREGQALDGRRAVEGGLMGFDV
jgi:hypothetical protein